MRTERHRKNLPSNTNSFILTEVNSCDVSQIHPKVNRRLSLQLGAKQSGFSLPNVFQIGLVWFKTQDDGIVSGITISRGATGDQTGEFPG